MGGLCSRAVAIKQNPYADTNGSFNPYKSASVNRRPSVQSNTVTPPWAREVTEEQSQEPKQSRQLPPAVRQSATTEYSSNADDFYDGIPRYTMQKSRSVRSTQAAVAKVCHIVESRFVMFLEFQNHDLTQWCCNVFSIHQYLFFLLMEVLVVS